MGKTFEKTNLGTTGRNEKIGAVHGHKVGKSYQTPNMRPGVQPAPKPEKPGFTGKTKDIPYK